MSDRPISIELKSISEIENEPTFALTFVIFNEEHRQKKTLFVSQAKCRELGLSRGKISAETFELLEKEAKRSSAYQKGAGILGYGVNSVKSIKLKLKQRGYDDDAVEYAAERLESEGYIREIEDAKRLAEQCACKLWGPKRILSHLFSKGYCDEALSAAREQLEGVDFSKNCKKLILKRYRVFPTQKKDADRAIASLMRYGYSVSQIKEALKDLK